MRISEMLTAGRFDSVDAVAELKRSVYFDLLTNAYGSLRTDLLYKSWTHGESHVERVMLLAAIIAMQQKLTARETELLLIACSYHDTGREDDWRDDRHGKRSADILAAIPLPGIGAEELRCIQAAVATHSTKDLMIDIFAREYGVSDDNMTLCRLLCKALKDADNLDRVRIHDLDVKRLRFDESRALKNAAESVYYLGKNRPV